jgi:hypothetical protein
MHLEVLLKLNSPNTLSSGQIYIKKKIQKNPTPPPPPKKKTKKPKKPKKTHWFGFFKKPGFFPTLP